MKSESIKELATALAKAQAQFPAIPRSKEVTVQTSKGSYKFKYAPFEEILRSTRPQLADNGLSFTQGVIDGNMIETTIMHSSGEWIAQSVPLIVQWVGPQALGSALSYSKRYGFCSAFGIHADDDDDGNIAEENKVSTNTPTQQCRDHFQSLSQEEQDWLSTIAHDVRTMHTRGDIEGAYAHLETQHLDPENKVALWSLLDSKTRSAIKKHGEALRKAA